MANSILAFSVMKTKAARFLRPLQDELVATRVWLQHYAAPATRFDPSAKNLLPWHRSFCLSHPSAVGLTPTSQLHDESKNDTAQE